VPQALTSSIATTRNSTPIRETTLFPPLLMATE